MNTLAIIVKQLREEKGITQLELAKKAGIGSGTLGDIETGRSRGSRKTLDKIIKALQLNETERLKIDSAFLGRNLSNARKTDDILIKIPVRAIASAGNGCLNFEENIKSIAIRKNGFDSNCYLIEVSGTSMEPLIQDGAYIVVDPREVDIIDGKIYVVTFDGQTYIKKVFRNEQLKAIILKSVNPQFEDIYIVEEMLNRFSVKGRAVKFILEGKL